MKLKQAPGSGFGAAHLVLVPLLALCWVMRWARDENSHEELIWGNFICTISLLMRNLCRLETGKKSPVAFPFRPILSLTNFITFENSESSTVAADSCGRTDRQTQFSSRHSLPAKITTFSPPAIFAFWQSYGKRQKDETMTVVGLQYEC